MNKIITINIGGIALSIEEDAYDVLRDYLKKISQHFQNTENGDEIVADIEVRIAEVLSAKLGKGKVSVNVADVKEVAETMGYPSDFEAEEAMGGDHQTTGGSTYSDAPRGKKRLFRDPDQKVVGGVCGGLSKYLDIDTATLRIIWVLSMLVFGFGFWIYIILWVLVPEAKTAAERLQMEGETPNIENIKNTITREATDAYNRIATPENKRSVRNFFERIIDFFKDVFGAFFKVIVVLVVVGIVASLVFGVFGMVFSSSSFMTHANFRAFTGLHGLATVVTSPVMWVFKIALYMIFALPLLYLAIRILPEIFSLPKPSKIVGQAFLSGWFLAIIVSIIGFAYGTNQFTHEGEITTNKTLTMDGDTLVVMVDDMLDKSYVETRTYVRLNVVPTSSDEARIEIKKSTLGKSKVFASSNAENIIDGYRVKGNSLLINEYVGYEKEHPVNLPNLQLTIALPAGKSVKFHKNTEHIIHDIENLQDIYDPQMAGHVFTMTDVGLSCMDCSEGASIESSSSNLYKGFSQLEVSGGLKVEVMEGKSQNIVIPDEGWRDRVVTEIIGNKLTIKRNGGIEILNQQNAIRVYVPILKSMKVENGGFVTYKASALHKDYFNLDAAAGSLVTIKGLVADKIDLELTGAAKVDADGQTDLLLVDIEGASLLTATELKADNANIELDGFSKASLNVSSEISGNIDGLSNLSYKGNPTIKIENTNEGVIRRLN